jgi:6-phosphogluconate dehydrogenase
MYNPVKKGVAALVGQDAIGTTSISELVRKLAGPRAVWLMMPSGEPTDSTINALVAELAPGGVIISGGNLTYKGSRCRAEALSERGLIFLDGGTSGGIQFGGYPVSLAKR